MTKILFYTTLSVPQKAKYISLYNFVVNQS